MRTFFLKRSWFLGLLLVAAVSLPARGQVDTILNRYGRYLLATIHPGGDVPGLLTRFDSLHQWTDLDYGDTRRANWSVSRHLERVRNLAIAWSDRRSRWYHQPQLWTVINEGLDHWLQKRYRNSNWWHNEIGVPRYMRDILVLLRDTLSARRFGQALEVLDQYKIHPTSTGANLIWSADLGFHYGALTGNDTLMDKCLQLILKEIRITTGDGVQPDYSFHQHGARLQMYQYGAAYLLENIRLAWECRGTAWSWPPGKIAILTNFVTKGWQWMCRGLNTVPGTMDRSASRVGALHNADMRDWIPYLSALEPEKAGVFAALADRQNGKGTPLAGFRYFPYSDFTAYQAKDFSFFLKTISTRTLATESINSENLKGRLLNSGDAYMIKNGREYFNLMPVWDWKKLPGVTAFEAAGHIDRRDFVGSVSDGQAGLTVMDYALEGTGGQLLTARKYWACHGNEVVCLIAGLHLQNGTGPVYTALDQCRWQDTIWANDPAHTVAAGTRVFDAAHWIYHAGLVYIFPQPASVELKAGTATGAWKAVNVSGPATPDTEKVFMPVLQHRPGSTSAAYVLASCASAWKVPALLRHPSWKILRNDTACQAVRFADGTYMIAFYAPGSIRIGRANWAVDRPCLLLLSHRRLYASNPAGQEEWLRIRMGSTARSLDLPANGFTTQGLPLPGR